MSRHTVTFSAERDLVEIDFRDRFVTENILAIIHALKALPDADRFRGVLWDLREADLSGLTIGTLRDVFRMKNEGEPRQPLRIACVVSSPTDAHILKLWAEGFDDARPYWRRWFFCRQEALDWLRAEEGTAP